MNQDEARNPKRFTEAKFDRAVGIPKHRHSPGPDGFHWASAGHRDDGTIHRKAHADDPDRWIGTPTDEEVQLYRDARAGKIVWRIPTALELTTDGHTLADYEHGNIDFPVKAGDPEVIDRWNATRYHRLRTNSRSGSSNLPPTASVKAEGHDLLPQSAVTLASQDGRISFTTSTTEIARLSVNASKHERLLALAQARRTTRWSGYNCIGDYHNGAFGCDFVSPYTRSAHNVDAEVFVLLQDWSSDQTLRRPLDTSAIALGYDPALPTNRRLIELLKMNFNADLKDVYATNLFPFVKPGNISSTIPVRDYRRAALSFGWPQVQIVQPHVLICLGLSTFNAMAVAAEHREVSSIEEAINSPFSAEGVRVWCQAHTGARGQNNRGRDRVARDWDTMRLEYLERRKVDQNSIALEPARCLERD